MAGLRANFQDWSMDVRAITLFSIYMCRDPSDLSCLLRQDIDSLPEGVNVLFLDQGSVFCCMREPNFGFCFYLIIRVYFPDQTFKSYGAKGFGKTLLRWIFAYGNFIEQDGWYTINIGIVYISYTAKSFSAITRCLKAVNRFVALWLPIRYSDIFSNKRTCLICGLALGLLLVVFAPLLISPSRT